MKIALLLLVYVALSLYGATTSSEISKTQMHDKWRDGLKQLDRLIYDVSTP